MNLYKPAKDDPVDQKLALFINSKPLKFREKMSFEREANGIYRFNKKRVFMKMEGDHIVIRVGGGYLSLEEFLEIHCNSEDEQKRRVSNLVYGGQCAGSQNFKTFYLTGRRSVTPKMNHTLDQSSKLILDPDIKPLFDRNE